MQIKELAKKEMQIQTELLEASTSFISFIEKQNDLKDVKGLDFYVPKIAEEKMLDKLNVRATLGITGITEFSNLFVVTKEKYNEIMKHYQAPLYYPFTIKEGEFCPIMVVQDKVFINEELLKLVCNQWQCSHCFLQTHKLFIIRRIRSYQLKQFLTVQSET